MGHLGILPSLKKSKNDNPYTDLKVATHRQRKSGDGWTQLTDWHRVRIWGDDAIRCCQLLQVGDTVAIEGSVRTDSWTDDNGEKKFFTLICCKTIHFVRMANHNRTKPVLAA
jgi:single-strand DNA-binding protein